MRRLKNLLSLLCVGALIGAGAFLPKLAAMVQDRAGDREARFASIRAVELELRQELSLSEKLMLYADMKTIPVSANETAMTMAEVYAAAQAAMEEYVAYGILQWFEPTYQAMEPYFGTDPEDPNRYMVFWLVEVVNEYEPYQSLMLHIDDATGEVMLIQYEKYGSFSVADIQENAPYFLESFIEVFLQPFELTILADSEVMELDGEVYCRCLTVADGDDNQMDLEFYVQGPGGFYVYFQNESDLMHR